VRTVAGRYKRVILLGMDGLDPKLLKRFIDSGALPAFRALAEKGGLRRLITANPPQSPVSWATLTTGVNPGVHGIFDFLHRTPDDYTIFLSMTRQAGATLTGRPTFRSPLAAPTLMARISKAGIPVTVLRWPLTFPAKGPGEILSGLGTPDVTGGLGSYLLYTTAEIKPQDPKARHTVRLKGKPPYRAEFPGPLTAKPSRSDPLKGRATVPIIVEPKVEGVVVHLGGQRVELKEGAWSPFLSITFKVGFLQRCTALVRLYLARAEDPLVLYASPASIDPARPIFPIAYPAGYSATWVKRLGGPFHTLGMPEDTRALTDGVLTPEAFLDSCERITLEGERMLLAALNERSEGLLGCVFFTSDRVQHMFWAGLDHDHPFNKLEQAEPSPFIHTRDFRKLGAEPIESYYRRLDRVLASVAGALDSRDLLLVFSDHGFTTYRRNFHVNRFLAERRHLSLEEEVGEELFGSVRWDRTVAYSCGFCGVYLNREGREGLGIVSRTKAEKLLETLAAEFKALKDPETGLHPVRRVWRREDLYRGPEASRAPDLILGLERGYRFSWQTALGGAPREVFSNNEGAWSGTHLIDPELVPAVLLANAPVAREQITLVDVAPTVLSALGIRVSSELEGKNFIGG